MAEIKLGNKVKCKYTGFEGIVVAKIEYINGCVQFTVVPKVGKDNKYPDNEVCIDEESLVVISKDKERIIKKDPGGPTRLLCSRKCY